MVGAYLVRTFYRWLLSSRGKSWEINSNMPFIHKGIIEFPIISIFVRQICGKFEGFACNIPETNHFAPENGWLVQLIFLWGQAWHIFRDLVSGSSSLAFFGLVIFHDSPALFSNSRYVGMSGNVRMALGSNLEDHLS